VSGRLTRSPAGRRLAETDVHLFERAEEAGEGLVEFGGPRAALAEIASAKLVGVGDDGGA
jgi:hypothetical protein